MKRENPIIDFRKPTFDKWIGWLERVASTTRSSEKNGVRNAANHRPEEVADPP
jgi:hypothetical protein